MEAMRSVRRCSDWHFLIPLTYTPEGVYGTPKTTLPFKVLGGLSGKKCEMVRVEGLEPPRLAAPEPKSGASTSSATPATAGGLTLCSAGGEKRFHASGGDIWGQMKIRGPAIGRPWGVLLADPLR